ncbi:hypothetical protein BEL04_20405 [Mucilaginibacter sp. PPCGB 2223]|uniref:hypothetical protein n=1 Tax=Mucilaginibacter sp. PPCGB 2223 TaxID=1886027 RepID=UPI000824BAA8|nr:hypothetical protein [Mucilaginibacter sp. PPCGB 2223]OCX51080.1 hypothetical protein BEL04_20405 [Mucilaginibacter sp. PPCGB 2223]
MGLFDFLRKRKNYDLPTSYQDFITQEEYNLIINIILKYHSEKGFRVLRTGDGEIVVDINAEEQRYYLDNLVRTLSSNDKTFWKQLVTEHFDKLKVNKPAYDYFFKDFEYASQYLRAIIKHEDYLGNLELNVDDFIYRVDFPFTKSFLIFDFDNKFTYIKHTDVAEWNESTETLFEIAISNTPSDEITIEQYEFRDKFDVFLFLSGDYSYADT